MRVTPGADGVGALVVREHNELVFMSREGMVQRTAAGGINRYGRAAQGVKVMNVKDEDVVSAIALVVDADEEPAAGDEGPEQPELTAEPGPEAEAAGGEKAPAKAKATAKKPAAKKKPAARKKPAPKKKS